MHTQKKIQFLTHSHQHFSVHFLQRIIAFKMATILKGGCCQSKLVVCLFLMLMFLFFLLISSDIFSFCNLNLIRQINNNFT